MSELMGKRFFAGLVKIKGSYETFKNACEPGKLIFAEITKGDKAGKKYIYANDIVYEIPDGTAFDELYRYVHEVVDASIDRLDASVSRLEEWQEALVLAAADNKITIAGIDGSVPFNGDDYVEVNTVNGVINVGLFDASVAKAKADGYNAEDTSLATTGWVKDRLDEMDSSLDTRLDGIDASLRDAIDDVQLTSKVENSKSATLTLTTSTEDVAEPDKPFDFVIGADKYIELSDEDASVHFALDVAETGAELEADASTGDYLTNSKAVAEYLKEKMKGIVGAFVFRGTVASEQALPTDAKVGDVYVLSNDTPESGDMFIWAEDEDTHEGRWLQVERNLTGAVTTGATLTKDKLVLGNDNQSVKASEYEIGVDTSVGFGTEKAIATESAVKDYVDGLVDTEVKKLNERIDDITLVADSSTPNYLDISANRTDDEFSIEAGVVVAESLMDTEERGQLADAFDVKEAIEAAGGKFGAQDGEAENTAELTLTAATEGARTGNLGKVVIVGDEDKYLTVEGFNEDGKENTVELGVTVKGLEEVEASDKALADAFDVSSHMKALEEKFDDMFDDLDVEPTAEPDYVLIGVKQENGLIDSSAAQLIVNKQTLTSNEAGNLEVTIDGTDILVGGEEEAWSEKTVEEAIVDLSTAIDAIGDNKITAEDALVAGAGTKVVDEFVAVEATTDENGDTVLDSSVLVATNELEQDIADKPAVAPATGLATDEYVAKAIINALAWLEIEAVED